MPEDGDITYAPDTLREPEVHSFITDSLPDEHPLAFKSVDCDSCGEMLHCSNDECMQPWVETGKGNFCITCFANIATATGIGKEYGLPLTAETKKESD